jgi:hypothetical protein
MTCIDEGAHEGDWCGMPSLVWVELTPPTFWLDPTAVVEVLLAGCRISASEMSSKVECSEPSAMVERFRVGGWIWVEIWGRSSYGWRR